MSKTAQPNPSGASIDPRDHSIGAIDPLGQSIWDHVSLAPINSLWSFEGASVKTVMLRTFNAFMDDNLLSRAAEMGYYFLFSLFPALVCASAILGIAARHASVIYVNLLHYLAIVIPHSAFNMVVQTFDQTTAVSTGGKLTLGLVTALWAASYGFSAIQDGMNTVYKVKETRPYWKAHGSAILVTLLLALIVTLNLAVLLAGDFLSKVARRHIWHGWIGDFAAAGLHVAAGFAALLLLMLLFATIYYYAPDLKTKCWRWLTPGAAFGIFGWFVASLGLRLYLHYFNNFSLTYGSLGAVIILLTWFYITGLMLLLGAEINSEIAATVVEKKLKAAGELPLEATTDKQYPVAVPPNASAVTNASAAKS